MILFELFGIQIHIDHTQDASGKESLGHHFESIIEDLEEDYEKLKPSRYGVNLETTEQKAAVEEAIGDILPVKMQMSCLYSVLLKCWYIL